jgi:hypothetical protein
MVSLVMAKSQFSEQASYHYLLESFKWGDKYVYLASVIKKPTYSMSKLATSGSHICLTRASERTCSPMASVHRPS